MTEVYECEVCHVTGPKESMDIGWGVMCDNNPECRPRLTHPRRRGIAALTTTMLDLLECHADIGQDNCMDADVAPSVLRALIDAAREKIERAERRARILRQTASYDPPSDDDGEPILDWVARRVLRP